MYEGTEEQELAVMEMVALLTDRVVERGGGGGGKGGGKVKEGVGEPVRKDIDGDEAVIHVDDDDGGCCCCCCGNGGRGEE